MAENIHLLVPVHNRRETSRQLARALKKQTHPDFQLVLIDDGSTDGTAEAVQAELPGTVMLRGTGAWWWAGSLDRGCAWLEEQAVPDEAVIGLLNDDVDLEDTFLERAAAELARHPGTLLLARQRETGTGNEIDFGGGVHADLVKLRFAPAKRPEDVNCLPTRGLFLRRGDLRRAGGFRPGRLPHYLSDYEFTLRAHRLGLRLKVADTFSLGVHSEKTGWSSADLFAAPRARRLGLLFSRRCKDNPFDWTALVSLAVPARRRPWLWLKVWLHAGRNVWRCLVEPVRANDRR